jgi:hypothetical protein
VRSELLSGPILIAISTAITALPPLRDAIAQTVFHINCLSATAKEAGKEYCDFTIVEFQVLIAFVIGGVFVTDKIAEFTQRAALSYQAAREATLLGQQKRLMRDLYRAYVGVKHAGRGITIWNAAWKFMSAVSHMQQTFISAGKHIPRFYLFILAFRLGAAFPKGFYGVVALVVFKGFLLTQITKGYFDYLPACM